MGNQKIKIFLADDHHVFRDGIRILLESEPPFEVISEAATGLEVLEQLKSKFPDILLLDIDMPEINGLELMKYLSAQYPKVPVLVLSTHDDEQFIIHMMKNGAKGYILKSCRKDELILAIKTVYAGGSYFGKEVSDKLIYSAERKEQSLKKTAKIPLTQREVEVLKLVAQGLTNQEIGQRLFISHRTVDTHRRNMMVKLDLHNAVALTHYAAQHGLLEEGD